MTTEHTFAEEDRDMTESSRTATNRPCSKIVLSTAVSKARN